MATIIPWLFRAAASMPRVFVGPEGAPPRAAIRVASDPGCPLHIAQRTRLTRLLGTRGNTGPLTGRGHHSCPGRYHLFTMSNSQRQAPRIQARRRGGHAPPTSRSAWALNRAGRSAPRRAIQAPNRPCCRHRLCTSSGRKPAAWQGVQQAWLRAWAAWERATGGHHRSYDTHTPIVTELGCRVQPSPRKPDRADRHGKTISYHRSGVRVPARLPAISRGKRTSHL